MRGGFCTLAVLVRSRSVASHCCSDAFFFNLCAVLLQLCSKFTDPSSPAAKRIDATFLFCDSPLFPKDEQLLCGSAAGSASEDTDMTRRSDSDDDEDLFQSATGAGVGAGAGSGAGAGAGAGASSSGSGSAGSLRIAKLTAKAQSEEEYKFVTRMFFLCLRSLHIGLAPALAKATQRERHLGFLQSRARGDDMAQVRAWLLPAVSWPMVALTEDGGRGAGAIQPDGVAEAGHRRRLAG